MNTLQSSLTQLVQELDLSLSAIENGAEVKGCAYGHPAKYCNDDYRSHSK
jgi:hypothetical protein